MPTYFFLHAYNGPYTYKKNRDKLWVNPKFNYLEEYKHENVEFYISFKGNQGSETRIQLYRYITVLSIIFYIDLFSLFILRSQFIYLSCI